MFLSAYESIQACQMMEELLGQVKARILDVYRLEFQVETRAQAMGTPFRKGIFLMVRNLAISHHEETTLRNFTRWI